MTLDVFVFMMLGLCTVATLAGITICHMETSDVPDESDNDI